MNANGKVLLTS